MSRYLRTLALLLFSFSVPSLAQTEPAQLGTSMQKASHWLGRTVTTPDGQDIGRVEDFAIDQSSGNISFVVVSVGSFLIEHNLIAVQPDALRPVAGVDGVLILDADAEDLRNANRFTEDQWPMTADVTRSSAAPAVPALPEGYVVRAEQTPPADSGTASITDGLRTAFLTPEERSIQTRLEDIPPAAPAPVRRKPAKPPGTATTRFDQLDSDGDDALDRAEIALEIEPGDKYSDLDVDASGYIERDEFDAFAERLESEY